MTHKSSTITTSVWFCIFEAKHMKASTHTHFSFFLVMALYLVGPKAEAQNSLLNCGTTEVSERYFALHPEARERQKQLNEPSNLRAPAAPQLIPVVFHVLHLGGPEDVSDQQLKDALRVLNEDFNATNPDFNEVIPQMQPAAGAPSFTFFLAKKDPSGGCTNGMVHHYDARTDWDATNPSYYAYSWDPARYLNIYVVRSIEMGNGTSATGYTYLPGSFGPGDAKDAVVMLHNYVGSIGTSNPMHARALTHELGHWFNLYHVYGATNAVGTSCAGNDFVSDTPVTGGYILCPNIADTASYSLCVPGAAENFQNFMDYSYCSRNFTVGQSTRMQSALVNPGFSRYTLTTLENLDSVGYSTPPGLCLPVAGVKANRRSACVGQSIVYKKRTSGGQATSFHWTFPGGTPAVSTDSMPTVLYNQPGIYGFTFSCSNATGASDTLIDTAYVRIWDSTSVLPLPFGYNFEGINSPTLGWRFESSTGGSSWVADTTVGYLSYRSLKLPSAPLTRRSVTRCLPRPFPLIGIWSAPMLSFRYATAETLPSHVNTLSVEASVDCEQTWQTIWSKSGNDLITSNSTVFPFVPANISDWQTAQIDLSSFSGADRLQLRFSYTRDSLPLPTQVYLDDIFLDVMVGEKGLAMNGTLHVWPNPAEKSDACWLSGAAADARAEVLDVQGRVVTTFRSGGQGRLWCYDLPEAGLYFIQVQSSSGVQAIRWVVH